MPNIFLSFIYIFFVSLLSVAQHRTPANVCNSSGYCTRCVCYFETLCVPSLTPPSYVTLVLYLTILLTKYLPSGL